MLTLKRMTPRSALGVALLTALVCLGFGPAGASAASRAHSLIAFVKQDPTFGSGEIFTVRPDGGHVTQLTHSTAAQIHFDSQPDWSPDGTRIAFTEIDSFATNPKGVFNIFVMNADGTGRIQITHAAFNSTGPEGPGDDWPTWSPDGKRVAYEHPVLAGGVDIFAANADGTPNADGTYETQLTHLTPRGIAEQPRWSPDGKKILFYGFRFYDFESSSFGIYTVNLDGSDLTMLVPALNPPPNNCCSNLATWSPRGDKISYVSAATNPSNPDLGPDQQLFVMRADGSHQTQLTHSFSDPRPGSRRALYPGWHSWSPDGEKLAFEHQGEDGAFQVSLLDLRTRAITTLIRHDVWATQPDWSPVLRTP